MESQDRKSLLVFVVDDETLVADTLGMVLRKHGFDAHSFDMPAAALQSALAMEPDLLISDVIMPELSGFELAQRMLERCPDCKVLLFSGNPATTELVEAANARGQVFEMIAKPVHPATMLEKIRALMNVENKSDLD